MKKKVNPGILPGFANLTHPKILTSSELENYMESDSWFEQRFNTIFCLEESQSVHECVPCPKAKGARIFGAIVFHQIPSGEKGSPGDWVSWQRLFEF